MPLKYFRCLSLPLFLLGVLGILCGESKAQPVTITVDRFKPLMISRFQHGVTHTQRSLDTWGDKAAIEAGKVLLNGTLFHNQHLMGWGALNPEPSSGIYDWASLDARIALIRSLHGTPVITLCGTPDWMKGGAAGKTDWSKLEVAPMPEHYDDFARLAATVARRYPDVKYFQVWNEFKGLWNARENNWDYRAYTDLYNQVYDALKAVNPDIKIGGPYLVVEGSGSQKQADEATAKPITPRNWKVLEYWLQHKRGADFITLDRAVQSFHDKAAYTPDELMGLTHWFGAVTRQVRAKTDLPLWWAEYYGTMPEPLDRRFAAAMYASIWKHLIESGASVALFWEPQGAGGALSGGGLFSDTQKAGGGQPYPLHAVYKTIADHFSSGTPLFAATSSSPQLEALASRDKVLLINKAPRETDAFCEGQSVRLAPYEVRLVDSRR
ncbi:MAG: hypothetical protein JWN98_1363 [Abditibacteriota bacterium]|jgi:hypothetical protein|nr:hypothetical protein [Abditibacteriota bacterium]